MRLLIDLDGVLANTTENWLAHYRAISGDNLQPRQLKEYDFGKHAKYPDLVWKALATGDVFRKALPYEQAVKGMRFLTAHNDVYIVTYSHESVLDGHRQKLDWVAHHLGLGEDRVVFTRHKHLVQGDVLVEDAPHNVRAWLDAHPGGRAFLIDQTYNRGYNHERCTRVRNMMDVVEQLKPGGRL